MLLLFSLGYGVVRTLRPRRASEPQSLRAWQLVGIAAAIGVASYPLRMVLPLGHEVWHLALAQALAWVGGFTLGVLGTADEALRLASADPAARAGRLRATWPEVVGTGRVAVPAYGRPVGDRVAFEDP
ncbi:MAG: hypothetical protein WCG47_32760 [Dermatophilaceae bacterium]